jgi:hypothetical protein
MLKSPLSPEINEGLPGDLKSNGCRSQEKARAALAGITCQGSSIRMVM